MTTDFVHYDNKLERYIPSIKRIDFHLSDSNPGDSNTIWQRKIDGHLMRGITDVESGGGGGPVTGVTFIPVASNPGGVNTLWVNSGDGLLYYGNTIFDPNSINNRLDDLEDIIRRGINPQNIELNGDAITFTTF